jgi:hypothetical protein
MLDRPGSIGPAAETPAGTAERFFEGIVEFSRKHVRNPQPFLRNNRNDLNFTQNLMVDVGYDLAFWPYVERVLARREKPAASIGLLRVLARSFMLEKPQVSAQVVVCATCFDSGIADADPVAETIRFCDCEKGRLRGAYSAQKRAPDRLRHPPGERES